MIIWLNFFKISRLHDCNGHGALTITTEKNGGLYKYVHE